MKMKSKKAIEWPSTLIYVIFVNILLLMGVFIVSDISALASVDADFHVSSLKHDLLAHRIINTHGCMAHAELTPEGTQVYAGVVDWDTTTDEIFACTGTNFPKVVLKDLDLGDQKTYGSSALGGPEIDSYFVKIYRNGELHNGVITITTGGFI